jgi:SPP1 gp7 family putative phage head morphogenesis protein
MANRETWEAEIARSLSRLSQRQLNRLLDALGDKPDLANLNPEFWNEFTTAYRSELIPKLEQIFLGSAEQMLLATPSIGVDWAMVNQYAADWARSYGYGLVGGITETTRAALQKKIAGFYENAMTMPQLRESLQSLFGPVRAATIAATETTRAAVSGQAALVKELSRQGIQMVAVFTTSADEHVCPICSPLNGQRVDESKFPPRHPNCRCDIAYKFENA